MSCVQGALRSQHRQNGDVSSLSTKKRKKKAKKNSTKSKSEPDEENIDELLAEFRVLDQTKFVFLVLVLTLVCEWQCSVSVELFRVGGNSLPN